MVEMLRIALDNRFTDAGKVIGRALLPRNIYLLLVLEAE
jgi:hypothetical protein